MTISRPSQLTERQRQIMRLTLLGCDRKKIAATIGTTIDNVDTMRHTIVRIMEAPDFAAAVEMFRILDGHDR